MCALCDDALAIPTARDEHCEKNRAQQHKKLREYRLNSFFFFVTVSCAIVPQSVILHHLVPFTNGGVQPIIFFFFFWVYVFGI